MKLNIFWSEIKSLHFLESFMLLKYMHFFHEISSQISTMSWPLQGLFKDLVSSKLCIDNFLHTYLSEVHRGKDTRRFHMQKENENKKLAGN